ncbi:restriction endonuclease subunit S [bacterium]|nr:MAG: restriction endonuclease subunit S [bacterium]
MMGTKNTDLALVPVLRFPEFEGEWEQKKLGDVATRITTKNKENNINVLTISAQFGLVSQLEYFTKSVSAKDVTGYYFLSKNDFAYNKSYSKGYPMGAIKRLNKYQNGVVSTLYICFRNNERLDNDFAEQFFENGGQNKEIELVAQEGARNHGLLNIGVTDFFNIELVIPSLPEQKRIASFFTILDQKLTQLKQEKTLLAQYKKGVMQQLFSQVLRFKADDGKAYPNWESKKLGDVYTFKTTNSFSRENLNYESGEVKNIHYGDIHTKFKSLFDIEKETVPFINSNISIKRIGEVNFCKEGDLVFADASEDYADIGKCIELINLNNEKLLAGLHTLLARPDLSKLSIGFGGYVMKSESVRKQIMEIAQGSKVLSISVSRLSGININIPQKEEQIRIANFLSAIDEKINQTQTQIQQTEQYKKGLLQKMFC